MTLVDNLTDASDQISTLILPDNTAATLRLRFRPRTSRWLADVGYPPVTLAGKPFQVNGLNLCCFPNVLRPWRGILPFGLAFMTADFTDPFQLQDFASGRVAVYLLTPADVAAVEASIIGSPVP